MNYLPWAVLALVAYSMVPPLMSVATNGDAAIPSDVATLYSNGILVGLTFAVVLVSDHDATAYLTHQKLPYVVGAGLCVTVGVIAYYRALSMGPVSVVTPVFGMFLVISSLIGFAFLNESLTARKVAGIALAVVAVYLVSVE
jgi:transporter family protein